MNKLSNEVVSEINYIYSNWDKLETLEITNETNIFTENKVIKHDKSYNKNVYFNEIDNDLKTVLFYDKDKDLYAVAVKNNQNLTYVFSNKYEGFFIFKEKEMIQSNVDFKPYYEKENTDIILDIEKDLLINQISLKDLNNVNFIEEQETYVKEIKKDSEKGQLDLTFDKEEKINVKYNLVEKVKALTGISLLNNEHESYAKINKIFMNIDLENNQDAFKHIVLFSILSTEGFIDAEYNILTILNKFFTVNKKIRNINLFIVREQKFLQNDKFEFKMLESDNQLIKNIKENKASNVNIYIKETDSEYDIFGFDFEGNKYEVTKSSNILNSCFFIEVTEELKEKIVEDKNFTKYDYIIDNKLYFNKINEKNEKMSNKYLGYLTSQIKIDQEELEIKDENVFLFNTINIKSKENNVYQKHYVMLQNIQELITGYLKNPNLIYKENPENETEEVQKEFLEMLFLIKDKYIKDISLLTKEEDNWNKSRKLKRIKKLIKTINIKLQKDL